MPEHQPLSEEELDQLRIMAQANAMLSSPSGMLAAELLPAVLEAVRLHAENEVLRERVTWLESHADKMTDEIEALRKRAEAAEELGQLYRTQP